MPNPSKPVHFVTTLAAPPWTSTTCEGRAGPCTALLPLPTSATHRTVSALCRSLAAMTRLHEASVPSTSSPRLGCLALPNVARPAENRLSTAAMPTNAEGNRCTEHPCLAWLGCRSPPGTTERRPSPTLLPCRSSPNRGSAMPELPYRTKAAWPGQRSPERDPPMQSTAALPPHNTRFQTDERHCSTAKV